MRDMQRLLGAAEERESWEVPDWSGVPVTVGTLMIVPLHAGDMRNLRVAEDWHHAGYWSSEDGEVEYHIYRQR